VTSADPSGQVVVVTGVSGDVGRALADGFHGAGALVVGADADEDVQLGAGRQSIYVQTDVTDRASVESLVRTVETKLGRADILLNCATAGRHEPALSLTPSDWSRTITVALTGTFNCSQAFAALMVKHKRGNIINLVSMDAYHAYPGRSSYAAAQAGVVGLTRALAVEWAPLGIRVNALAHGVGITSKPGPSDKWSPTLVERVQNRTPMHRLARPEEIVAAALFLAGPRSAFMTGQVLRVDGGWAALNSAAPGFVFP
jgi:NAD(P)-dependent dehydrogenase (short-subunit alcohol dehydrogenase family)